MKAFESAPMPLPLARQQSAGSRRPAIPAVAGGNGSPPKLPPRRGSRAVSAVSGDRSTLLHLRRSELAGWRTKSVFPSQRDGPNPNCFLPILKLRGLPFFCTRKHVCQWLGDLAAYLKDIIFVLEVDALTTGFGLVTFHNSQAAYDAWQKLHKAPIVGKRFVEVFALFPPHCPLSRRVDSTGRTEAVATPPPPSMPASPAAAAALPDPQVQCCFCGFPYWQHSDQGVAAYATLRLRRLMDAGVIEHSPGLMHTAFLKVPALLFQDAGSVRRHEIDSFDPDLYRTSGGIEPGVVSLDALEGTPSPTNSHDSNEVRSPAASFFDLLQVESYHMRILIGEIVDILMSRNLDRSSHRAMLSPENQQRSHQPPGTFSIADIGNRLSTRARAYLFLTETKLKNVLETFDEFFVLSDPVGPYAFYAVSLTSQILTRGSMLIWSMQPYQLSRRGRRRDSSRKESVKMNPIPLERRSTASPHPVPPNTQPLALGRATSCAVSRNIPPDPEIVLQHRRHHTPPTPLESLTLGDSIADIHPSAHSPVANTEDTSFSQVLVDFIKSAGLDSLMSSDTSASSRRLSQWTPLAIPPPLEALTPANRSRTCPTNQTYYSDQQRSPNNALSPVNALNGGPPLSWLVQQPNVEREVPLGNVPSSREELLKNLLKQRDEVDAKIEQALYDASNGASEMPLNSSGLQHNTQVPSKGLGAFANDLIPLDSSTAITPLPFDPPNGTTGILGIEGFEDFVLDPPGTFDPLDDILFEDEPGVVGGGSIGGLPRRNTDSNTQQPGILTQVEVSELLKALNR